MDVTQGLGPQVHPVHERLSPGADAPKPRCVYRRYFVSLVSILQSAVREFTVPSPSVKCHTRLEWSLFSFSFSLIHPRTPKLTRTIFLLMEIFLQNFFQYLTLMYLFVTAEAGVGLSFGSGRPPSPSNADSSNM